MVRDVMRHCDALWTRPVGFLYTCMDMSRIPFTSVALGYPPILDNHKTLPWDPISL